jgi:hypothetical protein
MASPANSTNQASGSGSKREEAIGDRLKRLGIEDDELDDLVSKRRILLQSTV